MSGITILVEESSPRWATSVVRVVRRPSGNTRLAGRRLSAARLELKRLHKQIMLSTAYRKSRRSSPERSSQAETIDPQKLLLWRMNLRRLDAEIVRDAVLAVSGRLDRTWAGRR